MKKLLLIGCSLLLATSSGAQQRGIINNAESPHVSLRSINLGDCRWTDGFWHDKFTLCETVMMPHMGNILKGDIGHGYNNFKIAAGLKKGQHQGFAWHDGDFFKWIEAATYIYAINQDETILADLDEVIEVIGKAQQDDGYLHTQIQIEGIGHFSNRRYHEMYNCGHLYTAACIHHRVTGKTNFLDIARKNADLLYSLFQPQPKPLSRFGFNQTQIMGLAELYRTTQDKRYLQLAEIFINNRGKSRVVDDPSTEGYPIGDMVQERVPLRKETEAVGHAVLALYYYAGAADVYAETGEQALIDALDRLWDNVVHKKMYVTGALGQTHYGASSRRDKIEEGFIDEYMMPNMTAYNETCANICNSMFSYRMLGIKGKSKYADVIERVLLNSGLSGISVSGTHYYYANPLRKIYGARDYAKMNTESPDRLPYLKCFCCPPNLVRTVAKSSAWAYSLSENGVAVNLYGGNELSTKLLDGSELQLKQETQYPWKGDVTITVNACKTDPFEWRLRIPEWAEGSKIMVNGKDVGVEVTAGTYSKIQRSWKAGDIVQLTMPMDVNLVEGDPRIEEVRNQVAVQRGPIVYCIESTDLPKGTSILDVYLPSDAELKTEYKPNFLGGVATITGEIAIRKDEREGMYRNVGKPQWKTVTTQFVPYFAWSNRGDSEMTVFVPVIWNEKMIDSNGKVK
ncbi:glycoside hydrolase family 127 protein [Novipirellula artificiosorum]|uniref:Non-reducing end beta-L-arabinofuranosidase n=1 Tax=Novipirellula artificiosorum TaxID=2528016 RepID=A0A5C6E1J4_9BACT|nr:beta-L-arabinofuranosidase domain-containing protein [Novipirellula artificiosorum]TWU42354.1 Non-reducing end beta-L-arabinofuranosidase [Novipirellula artificiosorum]